MFKNPMLVDWEPVIWALLHCDDGQIHQAKDRQRFIDKHLILRGAEATPKSSEEDPT